MDRVAIFVDGSNFYHALKSRFRNTSLRFEKLASKLIDRVPDRRLLRIYYYNAVHDQASNGAAYARQQRFFDSLRRTPYLTLCLGRLERRRIDYDALDLDAEKRRQVEAVLGRPLPEFTYVEKGVDTQLAVDMVKLAVANTYDVAVLVSGDGDFAPAVEFIKQLGKHVELGRVAGWPCNRLLDVCDLEVVIDETMLQDCWG